LAFFSETAPKYVTNCYLKKFSQISFLVFLVIMSHKFTQNE
jgi:hypothetical protein